LRVWFTDENALVRQKVDAARVERLTPLLTEIVHQGIQEARFTTLYPDLAGEVILYLIQGLQYSLARLHAVFERERDEPRYIESVVAAYGAYMDTIERTLGAPALCLDRLDAGVVREALVEEEHGVKR
jgi:hypothetical protein